MTSSSFLKTAPAIGLCCRSLSLFGSAPRCMRKRTRLLWPWYAASMSCVGYQYACVDLFWAGRLQKEDLRNSQRHSGETHQCVAFFVCQVWRKSSIDSLLQEIRIALPGCIIHPGCKGDGFWGEGRCCVCTWRPPLVLWLAHDGNLSVERSSS